MESVLANPARDLRLQLLGKQILQKQVQPTCKFMVMNEVRRPGVLIFVIQANKPNLKHCWNHDELVGVLELHQSRFQEADW